VKLYKPSFLREPGLFRFSVAGFLATLVIQLMTLPLAERFEHGDLAESILLTVVLISAVVAVGRRRSVFWVSLVLLIPAVIGKWLLHFHPDSAPGELAFSSAMLFVAFVIYQLLHFILRAPRVDSEVLCAGIATYLMLGLLWSMAYSLIAWASPDAFAFSAGPKVMKGSTSLYFSFITLCTVGYGDITPVARMARMLAAAEAMTGTLFMAVLISRLVSMYSRQPPAESSKG
jgi:voltage-gated potassium channel